MRFLQWSIDPGEQVESRVPWPREEDGKVIECHNGYGQWDHHGDIMPSVGFDLPSSADLLYLFSRGVLSKGFITVHESSDPGQRDVKVEVAVRSSDAAAFNLITVCRLEREEGHSGIGIFVRMLSLSIWCFAIHFQTDSFQSTGRTS